MNRVDHKINLPALDETGLVDFAALELELIAHGVKAATREVMASYFAGGETSFKLPIFGGSLWSIPMDVPYEVYMAQPTHFKDFVLVRTTLRFDSPHLMVHEYISRWDSQNQEVKVMTICEFKDGGMRNGDIRKCLNVDREGKPFNRLCARCYRAYPLAGYGRVGYCPIGHKTFKCVLCDEKKAHAAPARLSGLGSE